MPAAPATAPPTTAPTATCSKCHLTTTVPQLLTKTQRSFSLRRQPGVLICPRCIARLNRRAFLGVCWINVFAVAAVILTWLSPHHQNTRDKSFPDALGFMVAAIFTAPIMTLLHELAHATVGQLMGLRVFGISLGSGRRVCRIHLRNFFVDLRSIPAGGLCWCAAPPGKSSRWRLAAMVAAGPAVHLLALLLLLELAPAGALRTPDVPDHFFNAYDAFFFINALMLLSDLAPHDINVDGIKTWSDGKRLLHLLGQKFDPTPWLLARYSTEIEILFQSGKTAQARILLEESRPLAGKTPQFRIDELTLLAAENRWAQAEQNARALLAPISHPLARVSPAAWLAVALVYSRGDLELASALCKEIIDAVPWDPPIQTVCSAVALAKGDNVSAEKFLRQAGSDNPNWAARAAAARMWEELSRRKNNPREELKWRRRANRLAPRGVFKLPSSPAPAP